MNEGFNVYKNSTPFDRNNKLNRDPVLSSEKYFSKEAGTVLSNFRFDHYLEVEYANPFKLGICEKRKIISWIKLTSYEDMIDENGASVNISPLLTYGYWSQLGVADLLPRYCNFSRKIIK